MSKFYIAVIFLPSPRELSTVGRDIAYFM